MMRVPMLVSLFAASALSLAGGRLATEPIWTADDAAYQPYAALLGLSVDGVGDLDGDGFDDLIAGAPGSSLGCCQPGAVFVFRGSIAGPPTTPDWFIPGPTDGAGYGAGVGRAGDVNGDGFDDLIFAGSYSSEANRVVVFHGSNAGIAPVWSFTTAPFGTFWPSPATDAGDVNGDGYDDVIVGDRSYTAGPYRQGRALVFHGSPAGLAADPSWSVTGTAEQENLGFTVAAAGDVDGDGYDDVVLGTSSEARVYAGSATGLAAAPSWTAPMQATIGSYFSYGEVAGVGDVDADGYDDVVVGSAGYSNGENDEGAIALYRGSAQGLSPTAAWIVESDRDQALFGCSVDGAGDVDVDGYPDMIVGECAPTGAVSLFRGGPAGPAPSATWVIEGEPFASFGRAVRGAGDVNGDGRDDVIVGAPDAGRVYLFIGVPASSTGPAAAVPGDDRDDGSPLVIGRGPGVSLTLSWGTSCLGNEMDWAIYEGSLGAFDSHLPATCSTGGQRAARVVPSPDSSYFLVVPATAEFEGSYGTSGGPFERPASSEACATQGIADCP